MIESLTIKHFQELGLPDNLDNQQKLSLGMGFALRHNGKVVVIGGIVEDPARKGVGKAWTLHAEKSGLVMRRIHKAAKEIWPITRDAMKLERVEAETIADTRHCKWLERFGFELECVSRKWAGGQDYARYAWIR